MNRLTAFIRTVFARWRNRPQRLHISEVSEKTRADLGLPPVLPPEDRAAIPEDPDTARYREIVHAKRHRLMISATRHNVL